jgi:HEAT repeats
MTLNRSPFLVHVALLAACALAPACKGKGDKLDSQTSASVGASATAAGPSPEQALRLEALAADVDEKKWSFKTPPAPAEALEISLLLIKSERSEAVTGAALQTLAKALKPKAALPPEVVSVVIQQLSSTTPRVVTRALAVAALGLSAPKPDGQLIDALVQLSKKSDFSAGKGRYVLLGALRHAPLTLRRGALKSVLVSSLTASEPYVVIEALQLLDDEDAPARRDAQLETAFLPLLDRSEPQIRGVALRSLGRVARVDGSIKDAMVAALKDENPFVRSQACVALGMAEVNSAVPALVPLLDDLADNRIQYYAANFEQDHLLKALTSSYWPHVADAAQYALLHLANKAPRVDPPKPIDVPGSLKANAKILKAWYAKNKADFASTAKAESKLKPAKKDQSTQTVAAPR